MDYAEYRSLWEQLYANIDVDRWLDSCERSWQSIQRLGAEVSPDRRERPWYENLVVYALYPQHFNRDIPGVTAKLDHFSQLGVNCLWMLPVLESPMRDEGFDIADYRAIRSDLFPAEYDADRRRRSFDEMISAARSRNIAVIFDIAVNHVSRDHRWFTEARQDPDSPYREFFIWADDDEGYPHARVIFKGLLDSNWTEDEQAGQYYFHRFYPHQPDLNYRNPRVLEEMIDVFLYWVGRGIQGFRVDAAPYLWKETGTSSENLAGTHQILKIFRAAMDQLPCDILLLAEACQPPVDVVAYFGDGDECQGAYHFPLMPRLYRAMLQEDPSVIQDVLSTRVTPDIPEGNQWFTFLRCHDELTLEMVSPEEREYLHGELCRRPEWDFRSGEGISARLAELFPDPSQALFAHLLLLGLQGNPVIYYGDEFLAGNNEEYYERQSRYTGYRDSRNLVRGPLDWDEIERKLRDSSPGTAADGSFEAAAAVRWHSEQLSRAIHLRLEAGIFADGRVESLAVVGEGEVLAVEKMDAGDHHQALPAYQLFYHFSAKRSRKIRIESFESYDSYLYWDGSVGAGVDGTLSARDGEMKLPPRSVLWLRRR
jgi:maltose alpha-D-glucosyltransferase/alpha-amylase